MCVCLKNDEAGGAVFFYFELGFFYIFHFIWMFLIFLRDLLHVFLFQSRLDKDGKSCGLAAGRVSSCL